MSPIPRSPGSPGPLSALETTPADADTRRAVAPVICYPNDSLPPPELARYHAARANMTLRHRLMIAPRSAGVFEVPAGGIFRISCPEGSQVGDLNLFHAANPDERFYSGKTRALHGTHLGVGDRMWSGFPYLRPMATMIADTLAWYGCDAYGGRVHDVIGTRCDPYTHALLSGGAQYHQCCHSNLTRALIGDGFGAQRAEALVHDVLNVFMCTGFTQDSGQYFMKASPARQGDYVEFIAEIALKGVLSACPGGDCGTVHSSDQAQCHPLLVEVFEADPEVMAGWRSPEVNGYDRSHGM
ncbi:urea carboxylase-associated family protein [Pararhodobacter oceanensis]|uniref:DUF1989 domain-containing protein n=1 Tax=Pararhodobacter oceanensis TaxID=2172121 RepID=A0A2T8HXP5_9RHOB|nr:DUF1989 domain-containing protein [Pararhodobacter oceanensis]PVH30142.1 hypothetical protein DDE20_00810 [Pararhodobacter oceanensis]